MSTIDGDIVNDIIQFAGIELLNELVTLYSDTVPSRLRQLRKCVTVDDRAPIATIAHFLRSAGGNVGALRFSEVAGQLEANADACPLHMLEARISELEDEFRLSLCQLEQIIADQAS